MKLPKYLKLEIIRFDQLATDKNRYQQLLNLKEKSFSYSKKQSVMYWDQYDKDAWHFFLMKGKKIVTYLRVNMANTFLVEASFSRVCTSDEFKGKGYAADLVSRACNFLATNCRTERIHIIVRPHLTAYYIKLGFRFEYRGLVSRNYFLMSKQLVLMKKK